MLSSLSMIQRRVSFQTAKNLHRALSKKIYICIGKIPGLAGSKKSSPTEITPLSMCRLVCSFSLPRYKRVNDSGTSSFLIYHTPLTIFHLPSFALSSLASSLSPLACHKHQCFPRSPFLCSVLSFSSLSAVQKRVSYRKALNSHRAVCALSALGNTRAS